MRSTRARALARRRGMAVVCRSICNYAEALEDRRLLTTLQGGDTFEYIDAANQEIRVRVAGPSTARVDLVGATMQIAVPGSAEDLSDGVRDGQFPILNDIPGNLNGGRVFGGLGGALGLQPLNLITGGPDSFTDILNGPRSPLIHPNALINFNAISSRNNGDTYGVNLLPLGGQTQAKALEVAQFAYLTNCDATVINANLGAAAVSLVGASGTDQIASVIGCDFDPTHDNLLYIGLNIMVNRPQALNPGQAAAASIPFLFTYNVNTNSLAFVGEFVSDVVNSGASDVAPTVQGLTFDAAGHMVIFTTARAVGGTGDNVGIQTTSGLVDINNPANNLTFGLNNVRTVLPTNGQGQTQPFTTLRGLEIITPDAGEQGFVYAIDPQMNHLLHIQRSSGLATDFGPLPDPTQQNANPQRGTNVGDITWNSTLPNPATGHRGVMIGSDTGTDELLAVEFRARFPQTNLYSIVVTNADINTSISIAVVPNPTGDNRMVPTSGSSSVRRVDAQNGRLDEAPITTGPGGVFIGARTIAIPGTNDPSLTNIDNIPIRRIRNMSNLSFGPDHAKYIYAGVHSYSDLGQLLIGGTLTGRVDVGGSMRTLYAGQILTGDARGRTQGSDFSDVAGNFFIGGDIRSILADSSIGGVGNAGERELPTYLTGFNAVIRGRLGQITAIDSVLGSVLVDHKKNGLSIAQDEIEVRDTPVTGRQSFIEGFGKPGPSLGDIPDWNNDSYDTAQYVGSSFNSSLRTDENVTINGTIDSLIRVNDFVDYYAVPLVAGQTITVRLSVKDDFGDVGVFDPDRRLVASDYPGRNFTTSQTRLEDTVTGRPFQYTADRPGVYRFAIAPEGDFNFNGALDAGEVQTRTMFRYTLQITGVANMTLGAVVARQNNIYTYDATLPGVQVTDGDLGAMAAGDTGGAGAGIILSTSLPYEVDHGNLRAINARSVGYATGNASGVGIDLLVPKGTVGLLRNTGTDLVSTDGYGDTLDVNSTMPFFAANGRPDPSVAVGVDYQVVDAEGQFEASLSARRAIGSIRMAAMTLNNIAPTWIVNADQSGNDGTIDLIDCAGDFGPFGGGASIFTGPGGNVRYMHVGGLVYASPKFGGGQRQLTVLDPGEEFSFTDDSGTPGKLMPTPQVETTNPDPNNPNVQLVNPGQISVLTYGVDDATSSLAGKAGVILVKVRIDSPPPPAGPADEPGANPNPGNHGFMLDSGGSSGGAHGSIEIGELDMFEDSRVVSTTVGTTTTTGPSITEGTDENGNTTLNVADVPIDTDITGPTAQSPVDIVLKGKSTIDVYSITARNRANTALSQIDSIENDTDGEVVNVQASDIGSISAATIGLAKSHTGADKNHSDNAVLGFSVLATAGDTPWIQPRGLIYVHHTSSGEPGYLVTARARQGLGNIQVDGIIGSIVANADRRNTARVFEGINAPIVCEPTSNTANSTDGQILSVNIGEGLPSGGTGDVPMSGIFAGDILGTVTNQGLGSDIRGPIIVGFLQNQGTAQQLFITSTHLGAINLTNGAIINSAIMITGAAADWKVFPTPLGIREFPDNVNVPTFDIGGINLNGIGGILGSYIQGPDIGLIKMRGGFGFINTKIQSLGDNRILGIDTTGYGIRGSDIEGGASVTELVAHGTGRLLDTRAFTPSVRISEGGGSFDPYSGQVLSTDNDLHLYLGTSVKAPKRKGFSNDGYIEDTDARGQRDLDKVQAYRIRARTEPVIFSFPAKVGNITIGDSVNGLQLSAGSIDRFTTGNDVVASGIAAAGRIKRIDIGGSVNGASEIDASGPEGIIDSIKTKRGLFASVHVAVSIGSVNVGKNLGSSDFLVEGPIGLLQVHDDAESTTSVRAEGQIDQLVIGGNVDQGAVISATGYGSQEIRGDINGQVIVQP